MQAESAVTCVVKSNWETFDDFGNLLPFDDDVFTNEDLPYKLLSPQSFLAHHKNRTKTGVGGCFMTVQDKP